MHLTPGQLALLRSAIDADAALAALPDDPDGNQQVADILNMPTDPAFWVWRTSLAPSAYRGAGGIVWTEVDGLTVGRARIFEWLTANLSLPINAADPNVRAGIADAFNASSTTRANLLALGRRAATRGERIFAIGVGSTASPGLMDVEGRIDRHDVEAARNL